MPLAPLFSASTVSATLNGHEENDVVGACGNETPVHAFPTVVTEFRRALEECINRAGGADASSTLSLLDSLLEEGKLERVRRMFLVNGSGHERDGAPALGDGAILSRTEEWSRSASG